jgi:single-stranded-DNA-specific exonuclease
MIIASGDGGTGLGLRAAQHPFIFLRSDNLNKYNWIDPPPIDFSQAEAMSEQLRIPEAGAKFLLSRGLSETGQIHDYLYPSADQTGDPFAFDNMSAAVELVKKAAAEGRSVLIHGDYDVDGISGTAILYMYLKGIFKDPFRFLPDRRKDGYGLANRAIDWALKEGIGLLITVDCGTSDGELIGRLEAKGVDVIVCDHHTYPTDENVRGLMLNPARPGENYPNPGLCGAGVAFKLIEALHKSGVCGETDPNSLTDLLALGTVGDVMRLEGENRYYVQAGLELMNTSPRAGLTAMKSFSRIGNNPIRAGHISFVFAPRLNAPGRVGNPKSSLEILCTDDKDEARQLAEKLERANEKRKDQTDIVQKDAFTRIRDMEDASSLGGYVLAGDHWDEGVVGIAAARVAETFGRPAILLSVQGDLAKGSGRSIRGVDLKKHVDGLQEMFIRYGGHSQAVGLTMRADKIEEFGRRLSESLKTDLDTGVTLPPLQIDAAINLEECSLDLLRFFQQCEPFGYGNKEPVWKITDLQVLNDTTFVGDGHLQLNFCDDRNNRHRAIAFGWARDRAETPDDLQNRCVDIAFKLKRNDFNGKENVDLHLVDIRSHKG